jgi:CRISPR-associated protein Csd1
MLQKGGKTMIISDLVNAYDRLSKDPDCEIRRDGFVFERISFFVVINGDGELREIIENSADKTARERLPENAKKKTTEAWYLYDACEYLLGLEYDESEKRHVEAKDKKGVKKFEAFKKKNEFVKDAVDSSVARAVVNFLNNWIPKEHTADDCLFSNGKPRKFKGLFAFVLDDVTQKSYFDEDILSRIPRTNGGDNIILGQCAITGKDGVEIAKNHGSIVGMPGAAFGAYFVSVDKGSPAFQSYNKSEGYNCSVSVEAMKKYVAAFEYFVKTGSKNYTTIGGNSCIFWAECDLNSYREEFLSLIGALRSQSGDIDEDVKSALEQAADAEADAKIREAEKNVKSTLRQINTGINPNDFKTDDDTKFHLLFFTMNQARIVVKRYYNTTFGMLKDNILRHYADMNLSDGREIPFWQVLDATVSSAITKDRPKNINPNFAGELIESTFNNAPYSAAMFAETVARFKTDNPNVKDEPRKAATIGSLTRKRASFIKAYLVRDDRKKNKKESITMSLNLENKDESYLLGRLFAVMEKAQETAIRANSTIKDRYFASACSTPAAIFPTLLVGFQNHIPKIERGFNGLGIYYEKLLGGLICKLGENFPKQLDLDGQGRFIIGYYQQREAFFVKKEANEAQNDGGRENN